MDHRRPLRITLSRNRGQERMPLTNENVRATCPPHLTLADLPVAHSIGSVPAAAEVKIVGSIRNRTAGEKVHFCLCCNFPIAVYGRLTPCEHAFCLDCARSNSTCYICGVRIQKIQSLTMGKDLIFICASSSCHKSFLENDALHGHIIEAHGTEGGSSSSVNVDGDGDVYMQPCGPTA